MGQMVLIGTLLVATIVPIMYIFIRALLQERELTKVKFLLLEEEREVYSLRNRLNSIKDLTKEDVEQIIEENKALKFRVQDLNQLRQLDREAREKLYKENEELHSRIEAYTILQTLQDTVTKLGASND